MRVKKVTHALDGYPLVSKSWGHEVWIDNSHEYCGKLLHVLAGKKGSLHFHMEKVETMYLQSGHLMIKFIDGSDASEYFVELFPGESVRIPRGQTHQICGLEKDSELFEFSTTHRDSDSYRIEKGS
jgi:mannose-6-phosphate isomerase-like protein (cupin superfamily)